MVQQKSPGVESQDWLVTESGECIALTLNELTLPQKPYRLYRFLTEIEDILDTVVDDCERIQTIAPLVRKLLTSSYWLQMEFIDPPCNPGEIIGFTPGAIHSVEPLGKEPAVTFNLYGVTDYSQRFEFDPLTHTAKIF
jgi:predicted metal-dependent enzyme (double-stranded beta helix superfamily)